MTTRILLIGSSREEERNPDFSQPSKKGTLRLYLEQRQEQEYDVMEADSAFEALTSAEAFRPDIIFISYRTQLIMSFEIIRLLRENARTKSIPIVMATTMKLPDFERQKIINSCDAFLELPGVSGIVLKTINHLLRRTIPNILIVDDEMDIAIIVGRTLEKIASSITASSGSTALLSLLENRSFDLLITDVCMPGAINGICLAGIAHAMRPELPVIFMTGGVPDVDIQQIATFLGVRAVVEKPIEPHILRSTVTAVLSSKK